MARLMFPADRAVWRVPSVSGRSITSAAGATAVVYSDSAGTTLADILTEGGAAVPGSALSVDAYSQLPLFQGPDGVDTLYVSVDGGAVTAVYARVDDRLDSLASSVTAEATARAAGDAASVATAAADATSKANAAQAAAEATASATYALSSLSTHAARKHDVRRAKGGWVGTGGKGAVAWRVDHQLDTHRTTTWPILRDRGMPCGLGVVTEAVANPSFAIEPTSTTWDQLRTMHWEGCEIWSHSATHADPAPLGSGLSVYDEIVQSRLDLEAQQLNVMGWQMPGGVGGLTPSYSAQFADATDFDSEVGQLLLSTYGLIEVGINAANAGALRSLPADGTYAYAHATTVESTSLANAKLYVDAAARYGVGVELMFHPAYLGLPGYMSVADFTALADYVKTKWDAGEIDVLTPSALCFANPDTSRRLSIITGGDFAGMSVVGSTLGPWTLNSATGISVGTEDSQNYVRISSNNYPYQAYTYARQTGIRGAAFLIEAEVRAPLGDATAGLQVFDNSGLTPALSLSKTLALTGGSTWQTMRMPFCVPATADAPGVRLRRWVGDTVDFRNVTVRAV